MEKNRKLLEQAGGKLLTFRLGTQEFGIYILEAREVVGVMKIEPVPQTPRFMKGVINLRGKIVPVVDLRSKFGLPTVEASSESCIINVDIQGQQTGILVDLLIGVTKCEMGEFADAPEMGNHINTNFINGICKKEDRIIFVLDMQAVLSNEEVASIQQAVSS